MTFGSSRSPPGPGQCGRVFVAHEVTIAIRYELAAARLVYLINRGALDGSSEAAYQGGQEAVVRVGPFGDTPGLSKLVRVRFLNPLRRGNSTTIPLRWEATGSTGELFPVLDADLSVTRYGDDRSLLALAGSYRPPLGRAGAALDKAIMNRLATATIRSLLASVADAIADPARRPKPGTADTATTRGAAEPEQC